MEKCADDNNPTQALEHLYKFKLDDQAVQASAVNDGSAAFLKGVFDAKESNQKY